MRSLALRLLALALAPMLAAALAGCLAVPEAPPPTDGDGSVDAPSAPPSVRVWDLGGHPWPIDAAPMSPRVAITFPFEVDPESAVFAAHLFTEGSDTFDRSLADDLRAAPLRAANVARIVPADEVLEGDTITIVPTERLSRGARYALGVSATVASVGGARLDEPLVVPLVVAPDPGAGARATDAWPGAGTGGVPPSLPLAAVRFEGDVALGPRAVALERGDGSAVSADVALVACESIGWDGGRCVAVAPRAPLHAHERHTLRVSASLLDTTGAPVGPFVADFTTGDVAVAAPLALAADPCAIDELSLEGACVLASDREVRVRVRATGPARIFLESPTRSAAALAPRGDATLVLDGLAPSTAVAAVLRMVDLAGRATVLPIDLATTPPLAPLSISEVRANPAGPEPAQEYVEVLSSAAMPIDLAGFTLADREDCVGDVVMGSYVVPPGARALLVADGFDPHHPDDAPVPDGVVLVAMGTSLAAGGLTNAGEPLYLRDPAGRRVSAAPAMATGDGECLVRAPGAPPRSGDASAFVVGPCTPGRSF